MRFACAAVLAALAGPVVAQAREGRPGDFDHYVLALSWSPAFCALDGDAEGNPQCDRPLGFVLHGLWPQYEDGWPDWCDAPFPDPSRAETGAMADIMGTAGLAWHAWRKHGTCSGLPPADYFALSRELFEAVEVPAGMAGLDEPLALPAPLVAEAFVRANPGLDEAGVVVTCEGGLIEEVRLCLTREGEHRACGAGMRRCRDTATLLPVE